MRLTKKNNYGYILEIKDIDTSFGQKAIIVGETAKKLGQLEDLEDELGIDLIVLFKALKSGIYHKIGNCLYFRDNLDFDFNSHLLFKNIYGSYTVFDTKDYGKTWALTKEELDR